jgi:hypothetical protein
MRLLFALLVVLGDRVHPMIICEKAYTRNREQSRYEIQERMTGR